MESRVAPIISQLNEIVLGKHDAVWLCVLAILARGHALVEDLPGMGKTTLAQALSTVLGLQQKRIQFTVDVMPGDVLGMNYWDPSSQALVWKNGPIFTEVLLADELNRTTPKTQAALLEAMEERQVSSDNVSHKLPPTFFVIATQNPFFQTGTFPLPESQLDRFLVSLSLGYPDGETEMQLLLHGDRRRQIEHVTPACSSAGLVEMQRAVQAVQASDALADYVYRLVDRSRAYPDCRLRLSPRGGMALISAAKANAWMLGRDHVLPDDVHQVFVAVAGHRLIPADSGTGAGSHLAQKILETVDVVI